MRVMHPSVPNDCGILNKINEHGYSGPTGAFQPYNTSWRVTAMKNPVSSIFGKAVTQDPLVYSRERPTAVTRSCVAATQKPNDIASNHITL